MEHFDFNFHLQSRGSLFHVFVFFECIAAPRRLVVITGVRHPSLGVSSGRHPEEDRGLGGGDPH